MYRALATLLLVHAAPVAETYEIEPRPLDWGELPAYFDLAWSIPEERQGSGPDLVGDMRALVALEFDELTTRDGIALRSFGDVAAALRGRTDKDRARILDELATLAPDVFGPWSYALRQLFLDSKLRKKWDPEEDERDDGLYTVDAWQLGEEPGRWSKLKGDPLVEQGAAFVWGDLAAYKAAENDYVEYWDHVGGDYEKIGPYSEDSYFRGVDDRGEPFAFVRVYQRSDLPWPFSDYEVDVRSLTRVNERGEILTDVYSTSDDFHWLSGRDAFFDVRTSEGDFVGLLVVRLYGFDLDGVPDGRSHRTAALRSSLGNLKRCAEQRFAARVAGESSESAKLPEFRVRGRR